MAPSLPLRIDPGGTIGILGGGQLGRMLSLAAAELGLSCHVYCPPDADGRASPAAQVAAAATLASYDDEAALEAFAASVDVITYEFENIPAASAALLARHVPVFPAPDVLAIAQDRLREKTFLQEAGIAVAAFVPVAREEDLIDALNALGTPAVLKTRRQGYDGKGQHKLTAPDQARRAWQALGPVPAIVEAFIAFECEISVIVARNQDGEVACYDVGHNIHADHILRQTIVPAPIRPDVAEQAIGIAARIVRELNYVGVMGVEMFVLPQESPLPSLLVNEIAPRVHNSGHWTQDACPVSQFEQHIRAICGWPLGDPSRTHNAVMTNLLGDDWRRWPELARAAHTALHLYGKHEARPGRKMGHVTRLYPLNETPMPHVPHVPHAPQGESRSR